MNEILLHILATLKAIPSDFKTILERKVQLFVLDVGDSVSTSIAQAIPKIVGLFFALFGLLFALLALAFWLGEVFNNQALGFLAVACVMLLFGVIALTKKVNLSANPTKQKIEQNFIELSDKIGGVQTSNTATQTPLLEQKDQRL